MKLLAVITVKWCPIRKSSTVGWPFWNFGVSLAGSTLIECSDYEFLYIAKIHWMFTWKRVFFLMCLNLWFFEWQPRQLPLLLLQRWESWATESQNELTMSQSFWEARLRLVGDCRKSTCHIAEFESQKPHKWQVGIVAAYNASMQDTEISILLLQAG